MDASSKAGIKPAPEDIAAKAYQLWEQDGRKSGQDSNYWLRAEIELRYALRSTRPELIAPPVNVAAVPLTKTSNRRSRAKAG